MKKFLLLIVGVLAFALPETVSAAYNLMFAAATDFPVTTAKNNYWLIHCDDYSASTPTFYGIKSGTFNGSNLTTETVPQTATQSSHKGVYIVSSLFERLSIEKGSYNSATGGYNYKLNFNRSGNTYTYLGLVNEDGSIKLVPKNQAAEVQIEFKYGKYATIHYQGKELQYIDGKILFADPTGSEANKVYLFISKDSYPSNGVSSTSITYTPTNLTVINTADHTFTTKANNSSAGTPGIAAEGEQPSSNYRISGSSVTIFKGAAPGRYKFTAYVYNYNYECTRTITITVKEDIEYVWVYGQAYDADSPAFDQARSEIVVSSSTSPFEVSWNPGLKYFNVAAKNKTTGAITLVNPLELKSLKNLYSLSFPKPALAEFPDSKGFYFSADNSGDATTKYPMRPGFDVTSGPGSETTSAVPALYLLINAMKPDYTLTGNTSFAWNEADGTYTLSLSAPGVVLGSTSEVFYTAEIRPAQEFVAVEGSTLPDGNYTEGMAKVNPVMFTAETTDFSVAELTVSDIPCSGLYDLVVKYDDPSRPYIDGSFEAALPVEIYPSSDGIELGLVNGDGTVYYVEAVNDGVWNGLKDVDDASADNSVYLKVALLSKNVSGITGYYMAESAVAEASAKVAAAPEGYSFTDAATGQFMNLFDVSNVSLYPAKNGAIAPASIEIRLDKSVEDIPTGIDTVEEAVSADYYNLQGMRVSAPEAGHIYIMRRGDKTVKALFAPTH